METSGGAVSGGALQKEISRREAFERKNAELERVNDELRLENGVSLTSSNSFTGVSVRAVVPCGRWMDRFNFCVA